MGEQARGQSYDLKEQYEEVISPSRDMNKWISTMAFSININSFMISWTALSNWWTGTSLSSWKVWHNISVLDINNGWVEWSQVNLLLLQSLIPMTRTVHSDCGCNVCQSTHGTSPQDEVRNLCISRPTQVLQTLWTLHALDPLHMLFQSALAMYSLLNMMKSVVASQNIFLGNLGICTGTTNIKLFRGVHA